MQQSWTDINSENSNKLKELSEDKVSGETHLRHHVTADGYYRGRKVINK